MADQPGRGSLGGIDAPAGQQQVADQGVAQIPLESRNSAEPGDQPQPQFGEAEPGGTVGHDHIAGQRQLEPSSEDDSVYRRHRGQRDLVDPIEHPMDAFQKIANPGVSFLLVARLQPEIELSEVGPGAEPRLHRTVDHQGLGPDCLVLQCLHEALQLLQRKRPDFVAGLPVQPQLEDFVSQAEGKRLALKGTHDGLPDWV